MSESISLTPVLEDYLEAIYGLVVSRGEARVNDIAEALSVHKSTVTAALKRLVSEGFVRHEAYGSAHLTARGRSVAERVSHRHRVLTEFLRDVLLIEADLAERNACRMEHVLDKKVFERLKLLAETVRSCPGNEAGCLKNVLAECARVESEKQKEKKMTLNGLRPGESGRIVRVGAVGAIKRRIVDMGMTKGARVEVVKVAPLGDPIEIKVKGYALSLRKEEAAAIEVEKE
jgi:DtxR family Mn-dependent transcriptional regulator